MKGDLIFQNYLIVFIDLLGQKETLRKITKVPTNDNGVYSSIFYACSYKEAKRQSVVVYPVRLIWNKIIY